MADIIKVYDALDKSESATCIFVDLVKTFDTVSHPKLINTLLDIGFSGIPLKLMQSYL